QKEFYELSAFFNNTTQAAMDGNRRDTPPVVAVPNRQDRPRWDELPGELASARKRIETRRQTALEDFTAWLGNTDAKSLLEGVPSEGLQFAAPLKEPIHSSVTVLVNGSARILPVGPA